MMKTSANKRTKVLLLIDMEGIIGVYNINDNVRNHRLMIHEISCAINILKLRGYEDVCVCNIHNNGYNFEEHEVSNLKVELIIGIDQLKLCLESFRLAILIGFHGMKNSGGRFDHTFREDISKLMYGGISIGEVGAYTRWFEYNNIPVIMVSGEGNFAHEISDNEYTIHAFNGIITSSEAMKIQYNQFIDSIELSLNKFEKGCFPQRLIKEAEVVFEMDNPEKLRFIQSSNITPFIKNEKFFFPSLQIFFDNLYKICIGLNYATMGMYNFNKKFILNIKKYGFNENYLKEILYDYSNKSVVELNHFDRIVIAQRLGVKYEND